MTDERTTTEADSLRAQVRDAYGKRVSSDSGCCGSGAGDSHAGAAQRMGYSDKDLAGVPEGANLGLGCGAPLQFAGVRTGETVLDLGSGAGFDAFLAAGEVGPNGQVIGVDMTPEMLEKARENARRADVSNVEFREGTIEALPVDDESVDVVISNCVINLSPDKAAVFREAFRVLRPGGRLAVSDIVLTRTLPATVAENLEAYVGCVAGAALLDDYVAMIRDAGFSEVHVLESRPAGDVLCDDDPVVKAVVDGATPDELARVAASVLSAKVVARK